MKSRLTTYLILTVLFVSQSFASNLISCEQNTHRSTASVTPENVHAGHSAPAQMSHIESSNQPSQTAMSMDCCADDCDCPIGTCGSLALLSALTQSTLFAAADKVQFPPLAQPAPYYTALNKPPIFA